MLGKQLIATGNYIIATARLDIKEMRNSNCSSSSSSSQQQQQKQHQPAAAAAAHARSF
jgi:hypothetical protein